MVKTVLVDPILGVFGEFTTGFGTYFGGDWDVHSGYGLLTHGQMLTNTVDFAKSISHHLMNPTLN